MNQRRKPISQKFFQACEENKISESSALARVSKWIIEANVADSDKKTIFRVLKNGKGTGKSALLLRCCREALKIDVPDDYFNVSGTVNDIFGKFSRDTWDPSRRLENCNTPYRIVRLGYDEIENSVADPNWAPPQDQSYWNQSYELEIWRPDSGTNWLFEYRDTRKGEEGQSAPFWKGHAFATADTIFLSGADPEVNGGVVLFILKEHRIYQYDLLVGLVLAKFEDEVVGVGKGNMSIREFGVSRRIAAFKRLDNSRGRALEDEAKKWVTYFPLGLVVDFGSRTKNQGDK